MKPAADSSVPRGMRVEDRCRPPGEGRADAGEDVAGEDGREVLIASAEAKGEGRLIVIGESVMTVEVGEEPPRYEDDVGLDEGELTNLTVA